MGEATATPKAKTNHARTHTRRLKKVLKDFMGTSLDSFNMNHLDVHHPPALHGLPLLHQPHYSEG